MWLNVFLYLIYFKQHIKGINTYLIPLVFWLNLINDALFVLWDEFLERARWISWAGKMTFSRPLINQSACSIYLSHIIIRDILPLINVQFNVVLSLISGKFFHNIVLLSILPFWSIRIYMVGAQFVNSRIPERLWRQFKWRIVTVLVFVPIFIFLDASAAQVICCVIKNYLFRKCLVVHAFHLGRYLPLHILLEKHNYNTTHEIWWI